LIVDVCQEAPLASIISDQTSNIVSSRRNGIFLSMFPRLPLIQSPTPLHRLDRVSEDLGIDLWIKRDDLTGFAMGGNKGRKLEYLVADALAQNAEVVATCGSAQSNFIRQLAGACAVGGMICAAAVMALPYEDERPSYPSMPPGGGNVVLDRLLGVDLRLHDDAPWETLYALAEDLALEYEAKGKRVYRIPIGGSAPLGAYAFLQAAQELRDQGPAFDTILFASSSGSTHTGLLYGLRDLGTRILGVASDPEPEIAEDFAALAEGLDRLIGGNGAPKVEDFELDFDFVGPGYGVPSEAGQAAIEYLARKEGIFLDPIYSGKAFACLLAHARRGELKGRTLFWHTGGLPTLFV
jgi:D-cysteine desulfhydrase family pyridoxal phosphate-dependent enzyme